ncbi:substrate-binding domain-containing protein [Psychromonas sp. MB-3u-54]|uniref:substrate-binding domain-containing protein n=1 Tax=Psychromonas sp. MB-3u-54 TaxID=2058319 RepID=UPI0018E3BCB1|nr:substrate-binding domain-containing protein [Psychromonas sp. MB-3u-54]
MKIPQKHTLKNISQQLHVSSATVSNAFNKPAQLSKSLRSKILKYCEEVGYLGPSMAARSLRTGKTGVYGIVLSDDISESLMNPVANQFLSAVAEVFDKQHVNMLLLASDTKRYLVNQIDTLADAFIVYGQPQNSKILIRLELQNKPIITVDFQYKNYPSININNHEAAYSIAKYAIDHTQASTIHPVILGLHLTQNSDSQSIRDQALFSATESISRCRLEGYKEALNDADIAIGNDAIWQIEPYDERMIKTIIRGILTSSEPINLLLCMSDKIAIAALDVASELNITVPGKLQIVGFDGITRALEKGITTVGQPIKEKGNIAAEVCLGIRNSESVTLLTDLIINQSA